MEWLSSEEKSRSMMPYLLDLPPLDVEHNEVAQVASKKDTVVEEINESVNAQKKKEVELEK